MFKPQDTDTTSLTHSLRSLCLVALLCLFGLALPVAGNAAVIFSAGSTNALPSSQVLVPIRTTNFNSIGVFQFTVRWNPAVITYVGAEQFGLLGLSSGSLGITDVGNGVMRVSWDDINATGVSLSDGTILFAIRFQLADSGGQQSTVVFTNTPMTIEAYDGNLDVVSVNTFSGSVVIAGGATPPSISTQPQGQTVNVGANVNFTVSASGTTPLSYQWRRNNSNIGGATSSTLALTNVQTSQAGDYVCVVTNTAGAVTSSVARLTVNVAATPPSITAQPQDQTVNVGANVNFTVSASGTTPLSYQWRRNNSNIGGATSSTLGLSNVQTSQAGDYVCVVTNSAGAITSAVARLTVNVPDSTSPAISITSPTPNPTYTNQQGTINLAGVASDNIAVTTVTWSNNRGGSGSATGTTNWSAAGIGLQSGTNVITVTARDAANNPATDTLTVFYTPVAGTLTFAVCSTNGAGGNQLLVPIRTTNFNLITLFQFTVTWNPAVVSYVGVEQFGLPGLTEGNFGTTEVANGILRVSWDEINLVGASLPNGGIVFSVRFQLTGAPNASSPVAITGSPMPIEAYDQNFNELPVNVLPGQVTLAGPPIPPAITTQPQSQTVNVGASVNFTVAATGTEPLSYQWRKDGATLTGATSATLSLVNVQASQAGDFVCVVSNNAGSVTSSVARLTVNQPPSITTQPQGQTVTIGADVTFTVVATGTAPLSYSWMKDGATLATSSPTLALSNVQLSQTGDYVCIVNNSVGSVTSAVARLTVNPPPTGPSITTHPQSQTVVVGTSVNLSVVATGTAPLGYFWRKDGTNLAGATTATLALSNVQLSQTGDYVCIVSNSVGSVTSSVARLTVNPPPQPPSITQHPQGQSVVVGNTATFTVAAAGAAPLAYQWRRDNINVSGATSPTLSLSNVQLSQAGDYVCVVTNAVGSVTSAVARLTVTAAPQAPSITSQPQSQTVTAGTNVSLVVAANGTAPLSYQWKRDNVNIGGATSPTLALSNVQVSQTGDYLCVITNAAGAITSAVARLTINPPPQPPVITTQPLAQTVTAGTNVTLSVVATGTEPLAYAWRKDGTNLPGATFATLSLIGVQVSQTGDYLCVITNIAGAATSVVARLTVNPAPQPPNITTQPLSQTVTAGDNVSLVVVATGTAPLTYQWRKDGANVPGGNAATLSLPNIQTSQGGDYTCTVSNIAGGVTSASARLTVNPPADTTAPTVTITSPTNSPTLAVTNNTLALGGSASDNVGVTQVVWSNNRNGSGAATGTNSWTIPAITLQPGTNIITVTARDAANNPGTDVISVTYTPPIPGALMISLGTTNGLGGNQVLVPIRVSGFTRINLFQFSMHWDPTVATYLSVEQLGLAGLTSGNFGTGEASTGKLIVSWDDPDTTFKTLADGSIIFSVRFQLTGAPGASSRVYIDNSPTGIVEAANADLQDVPVVVSEGRVSVNSGNAAPVLANIGNKTVGETTILSFTAGANDSDIPAQSLTFSLDAGVPSGVGINPASGLFTWTPTEAQGPSTNLVTIRVTDNGIPAQSDFETITIVVTELNASPVLNPIGNKSVNEGQLLAFTATASDSDLPGQSLTYSLESAPSGAAINPNTGAFTWTPSEFQGPALVTLTVRVIDNGSPPQSVSETISVTIGEVNTAPVITTIGNRTATENVTLTFPVITTDPDLPAQPLTYTLTAAPAGASIDSSTGVFSWSPTELQGPSTNTVTVRVADNGSPPLTDTETFTIVVAEGNSPPNLSPIGDRIVTEIGLLTFTASASDPDIPVQALTYSLDPGAPAAATIHPTTGVFTWQHTEADGPGTNLITVRVTDNGTPPASASETIAIVINEVNAAPMLFTIANKAGRLGEVCLFTATATDSDIPVQTLTFSLEGAPAGAVIHPTTGVFSWTPSEPSTNQFIIRVTDNGQPPLSDSETIILTVNGVNTPPVLDPLSNRSVREDELLTFTADAEDSDSPRQNLFYSLDEGAPPGAVIHPTTGVFTWTPVEAQGPTTNFITVRVTDSGSPPMSDARSITVVVIEANSPPTLSSIENRSVVEGNLLSFTLVSTDSDLPPQTLTYSIDSPPAGASINGSGVFTWTPSEAQGPATNILTIRVTDSGSPPFSDFKTVTIVISEVNNAPSFGTITDKTVAEGSPLTFSAAAIDPDLPAQPLSYTLVESQPPGCCPGASIHPTTGVFTWNTTEAQGPSTNTFTIRVVDNASPALEDIRSFTAIVSEVNAIPALAAIGNKTVQEGVQLRFTATATDSDIPVQTLTFGFGGAVPPGAVIDPVTGVFTWTPTEAQGPSTNSVIIRVTDNGEPNRSQSETISIVVTELNTAPVLAAIGNRAVRAGDLHNFTAVATDSDLPAQTLRYSLDPGAATGATIDSVTGVFSWRPTQAPATNIFTVRVTDNSVPPLDDFETIFIIVTDANDSPVLNPIGNKTVSEGSLLTFTAIATDTNVAQRLTFSLDAGAPSGAAINPTNGVFTWIPTEPQGPSTNVVTIRVTDNGIPALSDSETITIVVNETESPPAFDPITPKTATEGTLFSFTATAADPDNPPRALVYSIVSAQPPACCLGVAIDPNTGVFTWTPTETQGPSTNSITLRVTEVGPGGASDTEAFTLIVLEGNDAPVLGFTSNKAVAEGSLLTFTATATDSDLPVQSFIFSVDPGAPAGAVIHPTTGVFTWTPSEAQGPATNIITIRVTDSGSPPATDFQAISVVVSEVNLAPILGVIGNKNVAKTNLLSFTAIAADPDLPAQPLTFSLAPGAPAGASIHPVTGVFTWTPSALQGPSTNTVRIVVTDNPPAGSGALSDSETFTIMVTEGNAPPVVTPVPDKTVAEGALLTFTVIATDSDIPPAALNFSLQGAPAGATINPTSGVFMWTPTEAQGPSTNVFIVQAAENASGLSGSTTIRIVVTEANSAPVIAAIPNKTVAEGSLLFFTVTATDSDLPAQSLTYSLESGSPAGAAIHPTTGVFTWTPSESQGPGTNLVNVIVSDGAAQDVETVRIVVSEVNFPPLLSPIADATIPEGILLTFTAAADDADLPPQLLTFSLGPAPTGATINATSGVFAWTPAEAQGPSTNSITLRVRDSATPPSSNSYTFVVIVLETNNAPALLPIGDKTIPEGALLTFTARATDSDVPAQQVTFTLDEGAPFGAAIHPSTGVFSWAPDEFQGPSTNIVTIRATDNASSPASSSETIRIVVNEVNRPPTFPAVSSRTIAEGSPLTFTAEASDPDVPDQVLTYSLGGTAPAGASIDPVNGVFSWTPGEAQGPSTNTITIRAIDSGVPPMSNSVLVTIVVTEINTGPSLNSVGNKSATEGVPLVFTATATDADLPAQTLSFSLDPGAPAGATINSASGLFTWTPSELQGGTTHPVTVRVTDNSSPALSAAETIQIGVLETNSAPGIPVIANRTVAEGAAISFSVAATDPDVPVQALTFSLDPASPAGVTITPGTGVFSWTPTEAQGPSTNMIAIRVTDNGVPPMTSTQTVRVVVTEINTSPVLGLLSDRVIPEGVLLTFTAIATDADLPPQPLTFSLAPGAPAGAAIHPSTGVFTWTPSEAQGPSVSTITVRVTDSGVPPIMDSVSFTVTVFETNNAPVLQAIGDKTVGENVLLTFTARATDSDLPAQTLTWSLDEGAPRGAVIHPTMGAFSWTPDEFQGPSTNVVVVRVTDNGNPPVNSFETIQIVVNEINRAPVLPLLTNRTVSEGTVILFSAEASDTDMPEQALSYSLVGNVPAGAFIDPVNAVFNWAPTEAQGPSTNTFTLRVIDDGTPRLSNSVTLTFIVTEANLPPSLAPIPGQSVAEGSLLTFTALADDPDLPAQRLRFTLDGKAPLGLSINANTGVITWTPTETQGPSTNIVSVRVTDNGVPALDAVQTVTILVAEANVAPVLAAIPNKTAPEGTLLTFTASATDADLPAQSLRFSLDPGAPAGANIDPVTGVFSWVPAEQQGPGTNTITVRVTEIDVEPALTFSHSFIVVVTEANNPPDITTIQDKTVPEGVLLTFAVSATDSDTPAQTLSYGLNVGPAGAAINPVTGVFSFVPSEEQGPSTNTVTIRVTDNGNKPAVSTATFRIFVTEANAAPAITPVASQFVDEGSLLTFTVLASDADLPAQRLTFSIAGGQPAGCCGDAIIDSATGLFVWTPSEARGPGTNIITIRVTDNGSPAQSSTMPITIVVNEFNTPPILSPIGNKAAHRSDTLRFTATALDGDLPAQALTFSLGPGAPTGASINPSTGEFEWEPGSAQSPSTNTVTIRVTDDSLPQLSDFETFLIVVDGANFAPKLSDIDDQEIEEGVLFAFRADATDEDNGQVLTFTMAGPSGAQIDPQTGVFTWTPTEEQGPGTYMVTIAVTDNGQPPLTDVETFDIEVTEENAAPVIAPIADKITSKDVTLTFTVVATDPDIPAQVLSYSLEDAPSGASIDFDTGVFTWTPSDSQSPSTNTITVKVRDSADKSTTRSFKVIVSEEPGNLRLDMFASPESVGRGEIVTFTMVVSNQGPGVAVGILLTNVLPANTTFISSEPAPTLAFDSLLLFDLATLPPGAVATVSVAVKTLGAGTIVSSAEVGSVIDTDLQDNSATASAVVGADPALSVSDAIITEINRNQNMASFEITLSASSRKAIEVEYFTVKNTALQLKDFKTTKAIVKFPPGAVKRVIKVPIIGDTLPENDETFYVRLRKPRNARIRRGQGICTIRNNDANPNITISDARVTEGNTVLSNAVFTIRLSKASGRTVTVNFSTSDGTALGGLDYVATNGTISFAPGAVSRTLRIPIYSERLVESNETFVVNLQDAVNGNIIDSEGLATIINDDRLTSAAAVAETPPAPPEKAPQDAALPLRISTAAIFADDVQITFATLEGKTYLVEHTDDLGKPVWQPAAQPVLGTGSSVTVTDPGGAAHPIRFYRVRIVE